MLGALKNYLTNKLSFSQLYKLRGVVNDIKSIPYRGDLNKLGEIHGTDKIIGHFYTKHYETHFRPYRSRKMNVLEIGVGGYDDPKLGGNSLRMWKNYFTSATIFSLDIHDKSLLQENRIKIFKGSQVDFNFLDTVVNNAGSFDIIIDDGSHLNEHVIETFKHMFPKLNDGGIYVVEDTQTSYWPDFGGESQDLKNPDTMMNFFKNLVDSLNHKEFLLEGYSPSYYDKKITSMHFYHNMIFIYKGNNDEESNILVNNQRVKK
jgi:demethylmacrocin O-methyltransferase